MKIGLIDSAYKKAHILGLGLSWLKHELHTTHGIVTCDPREADIIFSSVQSQQALPDLKRELKRNGINHKTTKVIIGGAGAYAPAIFDDIITCACVGEGRNFINTLITNGLDAALCLPETWVPGEERIVYPNTDFPWDCPPIKYQDGTTRIFVSRSCKRKCLFCQTGWESNYRVRPNIEDVYIQAESLSKSGKQVWCMSNDQSELDWSRMPKLPHMSSTFDGLRDAIKNSVGLNNIKSVRIGVEGVSERLRAAIGKPIKTSELVETTINVMALGITMRWFMIAGLPFENDEDYEDLKECILHIKKYCKKGAVLMQFHAFLPHPAAPLSVLPIEDSYYERYNEFCRWFFNGPGATRRVQIMNCGKPETRMKQACLNMCASETEIRRGWFEHDNKNWRVAYVGNPEKMRHIAQKYIERAS